MQFDFCFSHKAMFLQVLHKFDSILRTAMISSSCMRFSHKKVQGGCTSCKEKILCSSLQLI